MLHEFWQNFTHNLFKPLLLFFYLGFLIPILKVRFEFPYVIYQGLTTYLLVGKSSLTSSHRISAPSLDSWLWASS